MRVVHLPRRFLVLSFPPVNVENIHFIARGTRGGLSINDILILFAIFVIHLGRSGGQATCGQGMSRFSLERRSAFVYSNHTGDEVPKYEARRLRVWSTKKSQAAEDGRVLTA